MSMALLGPFGRIALEAPVYTLGSAPDNQLVLQDPKVSPRHAALQLQGQQYS
ncbi:MAG: FHA domain-containing protein, partial [Ktedonobacteraceae bacterium]